MVKPVRIQLSRKKGFDLQAHSRALNGLDAVNCARPGKWGNPFIIGVEFLGQRMTLQRSIALFRSRIQDYAMLSTSIVPELRGKNLACWCIIHDINGLRVPCHADVLLEIANRPEKVNV